MTCPIVNCIFPEEIRGFYLEDEEGHIEKQDSTVFTMHAFITYYFDRSLLQVLSFLKFNLI